MKKLIGIVLLFFASVPLTMAGRPIAAIQPSSVQIDAPRISVSQNSVTITTSTDNSTQTFEVYSMTGQLVKRITTTDRSATFELPRGCYIVRCQRWSKKIIIN